MTHTNVLPMATPAPAPERAGHASQLSPDSRARDAWLREMERAQMANWFQPTPPGSTPRAIPTLTASFLPSQPLVAPLTCPDARSHAPCAGQQPPLVSPSTSASPTQAAPTASSATKNPATGTVVCPVPPPARPLVSRVLHAWLAQIVGAASSVVIPLTERPEDQPAVRLHVEQATDSVSVWIGANPDDPMISQHLPLLLEALRRSLHDKGLRLATLTLNGRTVWQPSMNSNPRPTKETPWLSAQ